MFGSRRSPPKREGENGKVANGKGGFKKSKGAKKADRVAKKATKGKGKAAKPAKAKSRPAPDIWDKAAKVAIKRGAKTRGGR